MMNSVLSLLVFTAFVLGGLRPALAAENSKEKDPFKIIHVEELSKMMASKKPPVVYDANPDKVRQEEGIVPGAKLLESSSHYDVATTLPSDKKSPIVFYCHSTS